MLFTKENALALAEVVKNEIYKDGEARTAFDGIEAFIAAIEAADAFAKPRKPGAGRKDGYTKKLKATILQAALETGIADGQRHYLERLVEDGFLEKVNRKTESRGRPPVDYVLTTKGKSYANLSRS